MKNRMLSASAFSLFALASAYAQSPPQFDAATIKPDHWGPGERGMTGGPGTSSPGRVRWRFAWLRDMVAAAYHADPEFVTGPSWITGENGRQIYVFEATLPPNTSKRDFELMLQAFLAEHFKLTLHHETKLFPGYDLSVAPGGPRLKISAKTDAPDQLFQITPKIGDDGFPEMPPGHGQRIAMSNGFHGRFQIYTMGEFAEILSNFISSPGQRRYLISDKTGLTGKYDFTLKFEQGFNSVVMGPAAQAAMAARETSSEPGSALPNVYKALEQQLGLRLAKAKDVPVDTIVIDRADRLPTGN